MVSKYHKHAKRMSEYETLCELAEVEMCLLLCQSTLEKEAITSLEARSEQLFVEARECLKEEENQ